MSSTAARFMHSCHKCGGPVYENLVHHCGTVKLNAPFAGLPEHLQPSNLPRPTTDDRVGRLQVENEALEARVGLLLVRVQELTDERDNARTALEACDRYINWNLPRIRPTVEIPDQRAALGAALDSLKACRG